MHLKKAIACCNLLYSIDLQTLPIKMSLLMPLSQLSGVRNFHFNLLSPFLLIVRILSSQAIFFQILLYALRQFPWSILFPFILTSITSYIWELMSLRITLSYHHRWLWIIILSIYTTTSTQSLRTSVNTLSTSLTPHIILLILCSTLLNLTSSGTLSCHVSQQICSW